MAVIPLTRAHIASEPRQLGKGYTDLKNHLLYLIRGVTFLVVMFAIVSSAAYAALTPIPFRSQSDWRWSCNQMGSCSTDSMGKCAGKSPSGCAVTSVWMLLEYSCSYGDPGRYDAWLTTNGGFSNGCFMNWSVSDRYDGPYGLVYVGSGSLSTPAALKQLVDAGRLIVMKSNRFSSHYVALRGYTGAGTNWSDFAYWDPWDTLPTDRRIGDNGWVVAGKATQIYRW